MINDAINKLLELKNLDNVEIKEVFDEILSGLASIVNTSSFVSLLKSKGETIDETLAAICVSKEYIKKINHNFIPDNIIENKTIKTSRNNDYLDINLAVDIVCASNDLVVSRYCFDDPFFEDKTFKILSLMGIDFKLNSDKYTSEFEKTNFLYTYLSKENKFFKYGDCIKKELPFYDIFSLVFNFLNPHGAKNCFFSVDDKNFAQIVANLCLGVGYNNSVIVANDGKIPFGVSLESESTVLEAWKNKIFTYTLSLELLGFNSSENSILTCKNLEENKEILLNIFKNKIKDSRYDAVVVNSALALYIAKKVPSIMDGIELAKKTIDSMICFEKIEQLRSLKD